MSDWLTNMLLYAVPVVEACGALVILMGVVRTMVLYVSQCLRSGPVKATDLRLRLGQSLVMGLEFLVAADILKSAISPEWNDLLQLAALIGLRTLLNYLLEQELKALDTSKAVLTRDEPE
ncbi:MAG: DUF1622 domain-containing protein [Anaerolineae bacterium]|jgi:uncharacterized membrane protein|nr:DUF1622 domain-containing protein [Anaerolineae bacterium]